MKYVILISHGGFADGLKTSLAMFAGDKIAEVIAIGLKNNETVEQLADRARDILNILKDDDSVVVLADIVGGSPLTTLCRVLEEKGKLTDAVILGGMNLPMAITATVMKDALPADALAGAILPEASAALQEFKITSDTDDDEDDI